MKNFYSEWAKWLPVEKHWFNWNTTALYFLNVLFKQLKMDAIMFKTSTDAGLQVIIWNRRKL